MHLFIFYIIIIIR